MFCPFSALIKTSFYQELKNDGTLADHLWNNFVVEGNCLYCNGYYGQCYQRPVCQTCHEFVCPWYQFTTDRADKATDTGEKSDSEDSGNEDPEPERPCDLAASSRAQSQLSLAEILGQDPVQVQVQALSSYSRSNAVSLAENWLESNLPPEIVARVLMSTDDLTIWSGGRVCTRWRQLVRQHTTSEFWRQRVEIRWPVFEPLNNDVCWFKTFSALVQAVPCLTCLRRFPEETQSVSLYSSQMRKRVEKELEQVLSDPPEGIQAKPINSIKSKLICSIIGPVGTPYEGGKFFLSVEIPPAYPMKPPQIRFLTKIFHPNVSRHGDIGIDTLTALWCPALIVSKLLLSIQSIFAEPNPTICMETEIGKLYLENRKAFNALAKVYTWQYAMLEATIH